jgi:hypothetical protein
MQCQKVIGGHTVACTVRDDSNSSTLKVDVPQLRLRGYSLLKFHLGEIPLQSELHLSIYRVIIKHNPGMVDHQLIVVSEHKGIHLKLLHVPLDEQIIKMLDYEC